MTTRENESTGTIICEISTDITFKAVPKLIELKDNTLKTVSSFWTKEGTNKLPSLKMGLYVLSLKLSTGKEYQQVVDISNADPKQVTFYVRTTVQKRFRSSEVLPEPYFRQSKGNMVLDTRAERNKPAAQLYKLILDNGIWDPLFLQNFTAQDLSNTMISYQFTTNDRPSAIRVDFEGLQSKMIICPPNQNLKLTFKKSIGPEEMVHPWNVYIRTDNEKAEALLDLISSGAIGEVGNLWNPDEDGNMRDMKKEDYAPAVIGGYYSLKSMPYERLHNWAKNLADWHSFIPDGNVIYAWILIADPVNNVEIRRRLLAAESSGIPIYTQGLRLLQDGLSQLSSLYTSGDKEIEAALKQINHYCRHVDWTQRLSTFNGLNPIIETQNQDRHDI